MTSSRRNSLPPKNCIELFVGRNSFECGFIGNMCGHRSSREGNLGKSGIFQGNSSLCFNEISWSWRGLWPLRVSAPGLQLSVTALCPQQPQRRPHPTPCSKFSNHQGRPWGSHPVRWAQGRSRGQDRYNSKIHHKRDHE